MSPVQVAPGTMVVFSDLGCPWAHLCVHRLHETRARLGLGDRVVFDHRVFPLEVINRRPTPKLILDAETPAAGACEPEAGWQMWQKPPSAWPVTTLLPMEAVQAAKDQTLQASEELDRALRRALFGQSRCISMRHEILAVASECDRVDPGALEEALDDGRARRRVLSDYAHHGEAVQGSPHLFLADGTDVHNPGVDLHWEGVKGRGFPVVDRYDPTVYEDVLLRAA
jgi:predicted DsbA family dithiol-disulfide isomerase